LNVLFVSYGFPDSENLSGSIFALRQVEELAKKHKVVVLSPRPLNGKQQVLEHESIRVAFPKYFPLPGSGLAKAVNCFVFLFKPVLRAVNKTNADVIHVNMAGPLSLAVEWIAGLAGVPVVLQCLGSDLLVLPKKGFGERIVVKKSLSCANQERC